MVGHRSHFLSIIIPLVWGADGAIASVLLLVGLCVVTAYRAYVRSDQEEKEEIGTTICTFLIALWLVERGAFRTSRNLSNHLSLSFGSALRNSCLRYLRLRSGGSRKRTAVLEKRSVLYFIGMFESVAQQRERALKRLIQYR